MGCATSVVGRGKPWKLASMARVPSAVILAAGAARRYGGIKPLAPVGLAGESILELSASQLMEAGFDKIVLVVSSKLRGSFQYHVKRCWPKSLEVAFVCQDEDPAAKDFVQRVGKPPGTAHALACVKGLVDLPFGVLNADDLYGPESLAMLCAWLQDHAAPSTSRHAPGQPEAPQSPSGVLIAFRLANTVLSESPLTRAICTTRAADIPKEKAPSAPLAPGAGNLRLVSIEENTVQRTPEGNFEAALVHPRSSPGAHRSANTQEAQQSPVNGQPGDPGLLETKKLSGEELVSVNLWGFTPEVLSRMEQAVKPALDHGSEEVLLPDVVASMLEEDPPAFFEVLTSEEPCIGVTHPYDLPKARAMLASLIGAGHLRAQPWSFLPTEETLTPYWASQGH
jgi:hypothetical protein